MTTATQRAIIILMMGGSLFLTACGSKKEPVTVPTTGGTAPPQGRDSSGPTVATPAPPASEVSTYNFHGTPTNIDRDAGMITIDHEKIEGFMEAMTMPFKVADPAIFDQVAIGKNTHFTLRVAGTDMLITKVQDKHDPGKEHGAGDGHAHEHPEAKK